MSSLSTDRVPDDRPSNDLATEAQTTADSAAAREPDVTLTPILSPRWAMKLVHVGVVAAWGLFFMLLNHFPLRGTDLWGHVAYGNWILAHRQLPSEDPLNPLAEGMRVVDSAWLSQVIFASVERWLGAAALSDLFAVTVLATYVVLAHLFYLQSSNPLRQAGPASRTRRLGPSMLGAILVLVIGWSRIATVRPENFGALCFAILLWLIARADEADTRETTATDSGRARWRPSLWIGVPLVFIAWANLHGSFVCGLLVLGCYLVGRVFEVAGQTRSILATLQDAIARRWLLLLELALAATLVNPYGIDLLLYTTLFSGNQNLKDVVEWQPLVILGIGGREFALSIVLLLLVTRHSRRRFAPAHALMLAVFAAAVIAGIRMIWWYAAVFGFVVVPHLAEIWNRLRPLPAEPEPTPDAGVAAGTDASAATMPPGRSWRYSLVCLLVIWIAFALAPIGRFVAGGDPRPLPKLLDNGTPLALCDHFREKPPVGQIFNPEWWGDWLAWHGPPGLKPFMTNNMHLAPRQVWEDYVRVLRTQPGWQAVLVRYHVDTVVVDPKLQRPLARLLRQSPDWKLDYEDDQALVFARRSAVTPTETPPTPPSVAAAPASIPFPTTASDSPGTSEQPQPESKP